MRKLLCIRTRSDAETTRPCRCVLPDSHAACGRGYRRWVAALTTCLAVYQTTQCEFDLPLHLQHAPPEHVTTNPASKMTDLSHDHLSLSPSVCTVTTTNEQTKQKQYHVGRSSSMFRPPDLVVSLTFYPFLFLFSNFIFSSPTLGTKHNSTKTCYMFGSGPYLKMHVKNLACPHPLKTGPKTTYLTNAEKVPAFYQLSINSALCFTTRLRIRRSSNGTQPNIVKRYGVNHGNKVQTALKNWDSPSRKWGQNCLLLLYLSENFEVYWRIFSQ